MNNVTPRPRRRALTGVEDSDGLGPGFDGPGLTGVLSGGLFGLFEPVVDFGRRRLGLAVVPPVFAGLSFGRDVRNAPRTSSSLTGGAGIPITTAPRKTSPKTITLNRITKSPCQKASCAEFESRKPSDCLFHQVAPSLLQTAPEHLIHQDRKSVV